MQVPAANNANQFVHGPQRGVAMPVLLCGRRPQLFDDEPKMGRITNALILPFIISIIGTLALAVLAYGCARPKQCTEAETKAYMASTLLTASFSLIFTTSIVYLVYRRNQIRSQTPTNVPQAGGV